MKSIKLAAIAFASMTAGFAATANASIITYDLTDTPHGAAGLFSAGFYQHVGGNPAYDSLSFEQNGADVAFTYDSDAGTATLAGSAYNLNEGGLFDFELNYADVAQDGNVLTLNDMTTIGTFGGTTVNGKGFNLTLGDTITGHGWLTNNGTNTHFGDFHFAGNLVDCAANPGAPGCGGSSSGGGSVPVPASGFFILMGLAAMGARRKATKA